MYVGLLPACKSVRVLDPLGMDIWVLGIEPGSSGRAASVLHR